MSIVPMKKVTVVAHQAELSAFMSELQQFSGMEVTKLEPRIRGSLESFDQSEWRQELETSLRQIRFCIQHLEPHEVSKGTLQRLKKGRPVLNLEDWAVRCRDKWWLPLYETLKKMEETQRGLQTRKAALEAELLALQPVRHIEFSGEALLSLHHCAAELGVLHKEQLTLLQRFAEDTLPEMALEPLGTEKEGVLILILCHREDLNQLQEFLGTLRYSRLTLDRNLAPAKRILSIEAELEQLQSKSVSEFEPYVDALGDLRYTSDLILSDIKKCEAFEGLAATRSTFLMEGWVPTPRMAEFQSLVETVFKGAAAVDSRDPHEGDQVPVLLRNNAFAEAFEPVTAMYSLPSYFETDPTPVYAPFMLVFFGMMLSDAAYGMVMSGLSFWALKSLSLDAKQRKFAKLFLWLGLSTTAFGLIYGSYFGDLFSDRISPLWLDPASSPMSVLYIAIAMGVIHIYTGLAVKAWNLMRAGKILDAVCDAGMWMITIAGILMMLLGLETTGKPVAFLGAVGLVLTQGRDKKGVLPKLAGGLFGLYGITGYLGDVLSYSRLLALGLATGLIGSAFNLMVRLIGFGPLTFVFAVLIFLGGHTFNLLINILGAYVHAVRLQYLEFFGKFYTGGGRAFMPFAYESKFSQIMK